MNVFAILIPIVLLIISTIVIKRLTYDAIPMIVGRFFIYFCLTLFIASYSLSLVYTDYALRIAKQFVLSDESLEISNFDNVRDAVKDSKYVAQTVIDIVLLEVQDPLFSIDDLDDPSYREATETIALCFQIKGTVNSSEEHYLRNSFAVHQNP